MKSKILSIPCDGLAGIFNIGRLSLTSGRRLVFSAKFTLQANSAKNTMPAKTSILPVHGVYPEFIPGCCSPDSQQGSGCLPAFLSGVANFFALK
jgi:hypothetical protein